MAVLDLKITDRIARNISNPKRNVGLVNVMLPLGQGPADFFIPKPRRTHRCIEVSTKTGIWVDKVHKLVGVRRRGGWQGR